MGNRGDIWPSCSLSASQVSDTFIADTIGDINMLLGLMKTLRVIKTDGIIHVNPPCPPKLTLTQVVNSKRSQIL